MARKRRPGKKPKGTARWVVPAMLLILLIILGYVLLSALGVTGGFHYPVGENATECSEGQSRACSVSPCNGTSTCTGGTWGSCRWTIVCSPGSRTPCLSNGCNYAYKECNACGSGYGPCIPLTSSSE